MALYEISHAAILYCNPKWSMLFWSRGQNGQVKIFAHHLFFYVL